MKKKLWIYVTNDKYRQIIFLTDSIKELSKLTGVKSRSIIDVFSKYKRGVVANSRYECVEVEE